MQLYNYSILSTNQAYKLLRHRFNHSYGIKKDYLGYSLNVVQSHPNAYYLYHNLHNIIDLNVPYYLKHSSAVNASHHTAMDEALNPERYQVAVDHPTDRGHQKVLDRIYAGRGGFKYDTPNSSRKIYKQYTKGVNMRHRNRLNTYQKSILNTYKPLIRGRYFGNDIFSSKRKAKYQHIVSKVGKSLKARKAKAIKIGKTRSASPSFSPKLVKASNTYRKPQKAKVVSHMQYQPKPRSNSAQIRQLSLFGRKGLSR